MRSPSVVYFARLLQTGRYKIGTSTNLVLRVRTLARQFREGVAIVATMPGDYFDEGKLLRRFSRLRDRNAGHWREVFIDDGSIAAMVNSLEPHGLTWFVTPRSAEVLRLRSDGMRQRGTYGTWIRRAARAA